MTLADRPYLSIGEVLGLLLEEFPDVTISKIRFLESQGLIDPERTPSGYRKFYDVDVERLRVILREQRENFLPLKVIRDRLENGQIDDPSGALTPPRGIRNLPADTTGATQRTPAPDPASGPAQPGDAHAPAEPAAAVVTATGAATSVVAAHHATQPTPEPAPVAAPEPALAPPRDPTPVAQMAPLSEGDRTTGSAADLCRVAGITPAQLAQLEGFGMLAPRPAGASYRAEEIDVAKAAAGFLAFGVEARHLRGWKQAVDRESGLFEQMVMPFLRQRNPQSRRQAVTMLEQLAQLGGELRAALLHAALQHHLDS